MVNVMLTYNCNKSCLYCFAKGENEKFPNEMSLDDFKLLLDWFKKQKIEKVSLLGGEPTTHSRFKEVIALLKKNGIHIVLFTNGLFDSSLIGILDKSVINGCMVNYNPRRHYTEEEWNLLNNNLKILRKEGFRVKLSYNIYKNNLNYQYIFDACKKYNISNVRFCLVSPNRDRTNEFLNFNDIKKLVPSVTKFVKEGVKRNLNLELDCCLPLCVFNDKERLFMEKSCKRFSGLCSPACDINPDLSVYRCLPMSSIKAPNILLFQNMKALTSYFDARTNELGWKVDSFPECKSCKYKLRRQCQGGCLAVKKYYNYKGEKPSKEKRIGIRTWGGVGDGFLVTPVLRALKQKYNCKIYCVINPNHKELLENNPYIDFFSVSPDQSAFKYLKDADEIFYSDYGRLKPSINCKGHAVGIIAKMFSIKLKDKKLDIFLTKEDEEFAKGVIKKYKNAIILHITTYPNKEWFINRWEQVIKKIKDCTFIQVGLKEDPRVRGTINMLGATTVRQAIALVKYAKLFLGVDSLLNHATNATGTPGVVLFGGSTPKIWGYSHNVNIYKNADCSPCMDIEKIRESCTNRKCMKAITVGEVVKAVREQLKKVNSKRGEK